MIYINQHGDILHHIPLREGFNLRCNIQHLMGESEVETQNPLFNEKEYLQIHQVCYSSQISYDS